MKKIIALLVVGVATLFLAGCEQKPDGPYRELANPMAVQHPTVMEFFGYFCPHCYHLDPMVNAWKKKLPRSVKFIRVPVSFGRPEGRVLMRAYYLGELLGVLDKSHPAIFHQIHTAHKRFVSDTDLVAFFTTLGVERKKIEQALASEALKQKMARAESLAKQFRIDSVPTFVVNGRYRTDVAMTGSPRKLFSTIDQLLRKRSSND